MSGPDPVKAWFAVAPEPALALWGKARPPDDSLHPAHPLLFHVLDVAQVARAMLRNTLPRALVHRLLVPTGLAPDHAENVICFIIALHDLGKVSPDFQRKWPDAVPHLEARGFAFPQRLVSSRDHGTLSAIFARTALMEHLAVAPRTATALARAVAAHHGQFPTDGDIAQDPGRNEGGPSPAWEAARIRIAAHLAELLDVPAGMSLPGSLYSDRAFALALAGLTSVADWIGSMAPVFRYQTPELAPAEYMRLAAERAGEALRTIRMRPRQAVLPHAFEQLFGRAPRPLQAAVATLAGAEPPTLTIIEAPMGEGKTEAALYLAHAGAAQHGSDGLFFGLPTQATANQMLGRVETFLQSAGITKANLHLVHGESILSDDYRRLLHAIYDPGGSDNVRAEQWFAQRKRTLLAQAAVGTVDQALLGVLPVRHGFIRLFGLAGKTVVLDEVHAYDIYTSTLIHRLVEWLHALGASVIILSATLPRARRMELLKAAGAAPPSSDVPYPRVSIATAGSTRVEHVPGHREPFDIALAHLADDPAAVVGELAAAIAGGGCAGWICNTIDRAQDAYQAVHAARKAGAIPADTELVLLHSRFAAEDRAAREGRIFAMLGPTGARPGRAIVVGTQIFEQSLDLDFDILATDLAPVDLIFQRAGRLHRHARPTRPHGVAMPRLCIIGTNQRAAPDWAARGIVYAAFPQLRTHGELRGRRSLALPGDIEPLIERVYRDPDSDDSDAIVQAAHTHDTEGKQHEHIALNNLLLPPGATKDPFGAFAAYQEEDESRIHDSLRARTRLGPMAIEIVCLFGRGLEVFLDASLREPIDLDVEPRTPILRRLLGRSVGISSPRITRRLRELPVPPAWRRLALLCDRRPLVFVDRRAVVADLVFTLDDELGIATATNQG